MELFLPTERFVNSTGLRPFASFKLLALRSERVAMNLEAFSEKEDSIPEWAEMSLSHLNWTDEDIQSVGKKKVPGLDLSKPFICLAPGSVWPTKRWTGFMSLPLPLTHEGFQILILGSPEEKDLGEELKGQGSGVFNGAGSLSLLESLMFLSRAHGLVTNDSGAMHMASVVACPTVALFGPTVQELGYKPWNPRAQVMEDRSLLCRPCGQHGGLHCPIGTHQCMGHIKAERVVEKALSFFLNPL